MYVPGWVKVNANNAPVERELDEKASGEPASEARAWGAPSLFTHVTVVPVFTVRVEGSKAKFLIVTEFPPPPVAGDAVVADGAVEELHPADRQEMINKAEQMR